MPPRPPGPFMANVQALDSREARTDLTDRECVKTIGALLGGLLLMAPEEALRNAVMWYAANWDLFVACTRKA